jgi:hypothetical protein
LNNQGKALKKLFATSLKIRIKGVDVPTIVKLGVGFFLEGQPKITDRILACIEERMNSAGKIECCKTLKVVYKTISI